MKLQASKDTNQAQKDKLDSKPKKKELGHVCVRPTHGPMGLLFYVEEAMGTKWEKKGPRGPCVGKAHTRL